MQLVWKPQLAWNWKIACYLYLAGLGAGSYLVGYFMQFTNELAVAQRVMLISSPLVIIGTLFLIWDLGRPTRFLRALMRPWKSWIARGAWLLTCFTVVSLLNSILTIWPFNVLEGNSASILQGFGAVLALGVAFYTGIMIGIMVSLPMWNTSILPILFLVSAVSSAIGLVYILITANSGTFPLAILEKMMLPHLGILIFEALIVYFYLTNVAKTDPRDVHNLLKGKLAGVFWLGFIGLGLILPLLLEALGSNLDGGLKSIIIFLAGLSLLVGGFILRMVILLAGNLPPVVLGRR